MKTYKINALYECDGCESVDIEYSIRAPSEDSAKIRAMVKFRRDWLDFYVMLKASKAHFRYGFKWQNEFAPGVCIINFNKAD